MTKKLSKEEKIKSIAADDYELLTQYSSENERIKCRCIRCGYEWSEFPKALSKKDYMCPNCISKIKCESRINKNIIHIFKNSKGITITEKQGRTLVCKCRALGHIFEVKNYAKRKKIQCPECLKIERIKRSRNSENTTIRRKCEHMAWCFSTGNYLCETCSMKDTPYYSKSEFINMIQENDPQIEVIGEYIDSYTKIQCKCRICNYIWGAMPWNLLKGFGCPHCNQSKGERKIFNYLRKHEIEFFTEYSFADCSYKKKLRFDFYLPKYNAAIEFDGKQHFQPVEYFGGETAFRENIKRDRIKDKYCKRNKIKLLRIKYDESNIESILDSFLLEL